MYSCGKEKNIIAKNNNENFFYEEAWRNLDQKKEDSAFYYFNKSKNTFLKSNDSLGVAKCLMNMSIIQRNYGDFFGSQENGIKALTIFNNINDTIYIGTVITVLGTNEMELGNYEQSLHYLNKALGKSSQTEYRNIILNNKAITFSKLNFNDSCFIILKNLINTDKKENAKYIDNYEYLKWRKNNNYNAEPKLLEALEKREKMKDFWGQNASHAHLSDYYENKNVEKSLFHAHRMYELAQEIKSPNDRLEALQKLVSLENHENAARYFKTYIKLNDSLQITKNKTKNQFALIQYESEKNREDFLKAQTENIKNSYQILQRNIALVLTILALIIVYFWYRRRQKRLQQEKQLEVQETALKYSKKVHDVVSNGIYQVMSKIENTEDVDKNEILDHLENVYEKSRDISYDDVIGTVTSDFKTQLSTLVKSFSSDKLQPILIGNDDEVWTEVSEKLRAEILIIVQELFVNMKKHSKANKVLLKFETSDKQLIISYSDDGIGLKPDFKKKNGLRNTETRIFSHHGTLNFEPVIGKGLQLNISFPLKN